jgi:hypothetical protein
MTSWTITNWTVAQPWNNVPFLNEFVDAINERAAVVGADAVPAVVAGDTVQIHSLIESWQTAIEGMVTSFVVSHAGGTPLGLGYYHNKTDAPLYANLAAAFSAAGLATSTWRAYTTRPAKGGTDQARKIAGGDVIFGPLFEDLQKVLGVMDLTRQLITIGQTSEGKFGQSTAWQSTWAAAVAQAAAAYAASGTTEAALDPQARCQGWWSAGPLYWARFDRVRTKWTVPTFSATVAHTVEFYAWASLSAPPYAVFFDDNDDDVIEEKLFLFDTVGPVVDETIETAWLGSLAQPNPSPGLTGEYNWEEQGWDVADVISPPGGNIVALVHWAVAGGFQYV